jgi:hypothetical protein
MLPFGEVDGVSGFHERTLRKWVRAGKLLAVRKVGQCQGHPAELAGWLEAVLPNIWFRAPMAVVRR